MAIEKLEWALGWPGPERFCCGRCGETLAVGLRPGRRARFMQLTSRSEYGRHTLLRCVVRWYRFSQHDKAAERAREHDAEGER